VQSTQRAPLLPQAVSAPPMVQTSFVSQQPVHVVAQLGLPASTVGAVQILTGSVGAAGIGAQVSPRAKHSADDVHSWSGPMGVVAHGPRWQVVVIVIMAQHTSPAGHPVELVHVTPDAPLLLLEAPPPLELPITEFPPLLALPPTIDPLLDPPPLPLDPPLLELGLSPVGTAFASSFPASGPGTVSSLPPHADSAKAAKAATRNSDPRRAIIFTRSSRSSKTNQETITYRSTRCHYRQEFAGFRRKATNPAAPRASTRAATCLHAGSKNRERARRRDRV
jgi:hypothetical protein